MTERLVKEIFEQASMMGAQGKLAYFDFEKMSLEELEMMLEDMKAEEARLSASPLLT